jgi:hypothetical protein
MGLHLENMKKILLILITLFTSVSFAAEEADEIFLVTLNKCVINELNMKENQDLRLLAAPEMSMVCSRKGQISCKILKKEDGKFQLVGEMFFKVFADVGDMGEIRSDNQHESLVLNQRLNKAVYTSLEIASQSVVKQLVCSGTLKDTREIKKTIIPPKRSSDKKNEPLELTPSRIGD